MAKVIRKLDGKILFSECDVADNAFARMRGLLGREGLRETQAVWFMPCNSIHTFFMGFAIDAAFLDKKGEVIAIYDSIVPWRLTRIHLRAKSVLESAAGSLKRLGIKKGEVLEICLTS